MRRMTAWGRFALWVVCLTAPGLAYAQLDSAQSKCLNALNNDASKLAKTQGKANTACLKSAAKGKLPAGQSADGPIADAKGKIAKAGGPQPSSPIRDRQSAAVRHPPERRVRSTTVDQSLNLLADVFGASLTATTASARRLAFS